MTTTIVNSLLETITVTVITTTITTAIVRLSLPTAATSHTLFRMTLAQVLGERVVTRGSSECPSEMTASLVVSTLWCVQSMFN